MASSVHAQNSWNLTTADFESREVRLLALDAKGARVAPLPNGDEQVVSIDRFLQIDRSVSSSAPAPQQQQAGGKFVLYLASGDRLSGRPAGVENEALRWETTNLGSPMLPLRQLRALALAGRTVERLDEPRAEDVITLANGDVVRGIVTDLSDETITVSVGGDAVPVPMGSVSAVLFASAGTAEGQPNGAGKPAFRVELTDGSTVTAGTIELSDQQARVELPGGTSSAIPVDKIRSVEQVNGPVRWLSSITPSENTQVSYFDLPWPARMDRTVTGDPIRFGERVFPRGIGVHAFSRLTFPVPDGYAAVRTRYAIDGDRPYANVTVRIKLGDQVVHEKPDVRAGVLSPVVAIPLNGAKSITLEVDYGQTYDVQDRFNWIEPALVKQLPNPNPPTTRPTLEQARF